MARGEIEEARAVIESCRFTGAVRSRFTGQPSAIIAGKHRPGALDRRPDDDPTEKYSREIDRHHVGTREKTPNARTRPFVIHLP